MTKSRTTSTDTGNSVIWFELSEENFQLLMFLLGLAGGAASKDGMPGLLLKSIELANHLMEQKNTGAGEWLKS
jgi:hypothetical protein